MAGLDDLPKGKGGTKLPTTPVKATGGLDSLPGTAAPKAPGKSLGDKAKGVAGGALKLITAPLGALQQATFRVGSGLGELGPGGGGAGEAVKEFGRGLKELGTAGYGQSDIGFSEATTPVKLREQGIVRKLPTGVETAANIVLDPLFPTAFSKAKNIKQATKVAESVLGKEGAEKIAQGGLKSLTPAERATLESGIAQKSLETTATGGRRTLAEIAQGVKNPAKMTAQEGAERLVGKTIKGLEYAEKAKPVTAIGRGAETLGEGVGKGLKIVGNKALDNTLGRALEEAVRPRVGIIRDFSKDMADKFKALGDERLARFARRSGNVLTDVNARMSTLIKEGGELTAEESKLLGPALRGEQWAVDTLKADKSARGAALNDVFDYANNLEGKSRTMAEAAAGGEKATKPAKAAAIAVTEVEGESPAMAKLREILARQGTTPEALKAANEGKAVAGAAEAAAPAAEAAAKKATDLDKTLGGPIGDVNPIKDVLNRHFQMIHAEETGASLGKMKTVITDPDTGEALLRKVGTKDELPEGWERLKSKYWTGHAAPKSIAQEIDRVGRIIDDTTVVGRLDKFVDKFDRLWKTSATSLFLNPAFTARNARSNLFLNWLDGIHTVAPYREALQIQRKAGSVLKGEKYAAEIKALGPEAVMKKVLSNREYKIWDLAQKNRVLGANYYDIDLALRGAGKVSKVKGVSEEMGALGKVKQGVENYAEAGRKINGAVEDNARLANFIHNLDKTGDAGIAAQHTQKFLFDYGDLTKLEQDKLKKWVPFYTFMRKNTPLQFESALKMPGKVGARLKIGEAVSQPVPGNAPSYMARSGGMQLPGLAGALGVKGAAVLLPDNPMTAATKTVEPFVNLAKLAPAIATGNGEQLKTMPADVWRPMVSLLGGARGAPLKAIFGEAAQKDLFSGAEVPPEDVRLRFMNAMMPAWQRFLSTLPNEQKADLLSHISQKKVTKEDKEALRTWLIRQAGVQVREVK